MLREIGVLRDAAVHNMPSGRDGGEDALGPGAAAWVRAAVPRLGVVGREDVVGGDVDSRWVGVGHVPVDLVGKRVAR